MALPAVHLPPGPVTRVDVAGVSPPHTALPLHGVPLPAPGVDHRHLHPKSRLLCPKIKVFNFCGKLKNEFVKNSLNYLDFGMTIQTILSDKMFFFSAKIQILVG